MRRVVFVCLAALLVGCSSSRPDPSSDRDREEASEKTPVPEKDDVKKEAHEDDGKGPHGGIIDGWASDRTEGKYHVEICIDRGKRQVTVYVLSDDARTPAPIQTAQLLLKMQKPSFEVALVAAPLPEDGKKSSRFVGTHEKLGQTQPFEGTISGKVEGEELRGTFAEPLVERP